MRGLEARVSRLEQAIGANDPLVVVLRCFAGGELYGYESRISGETPVTIVQNPGESDAHLLGRAEKSCKVVNGCMTLKELRQ